MKNGIKPFLFVANVNYQVKNTVVFVHLTVTKISTEKTVSKISLEKNVAIQLDQSNFSIHSIELILKVEAGWFSQSLQ